MSSTSTTNISDFSQTALNRDTDSGPSRVNANPPESVFSYEGSLDVFKELVESPDDFLGMLAYSLYKQHKIEWLQSHPQDDHQAFKKVACTSLQVGMYRNQAEQLAKNFIDVSLEALGEEMRQNILSDEIMTRVNAMQPALSAEIKAIKPTKTEAALGHFKGGLASAIVALTLFAVFNLYGKFQKEGGLEGVVKNWLSSDSTESPPQPPAPTLSQKPTSGQ
ncbi:hypothetical protein DQ397_000834 [Pseudomonas sp. CK-NBRI-02]|uniref:hypothetical protein n=1 Tax=Pseudomonas sp. CK-NBRI-02 TaxID=2249759 RepID=UPI0011E838ED|nr:hypothetical protein [Pseudomonas sp. CK-NBRI-02]TYO83739.1 hypothetical protein DQ397_000834 [Pseudomonas sp. CK-NBRI-02]